MVQATANSARLRLSQFVMGWGKAALWRRRVNSTGWRLGWVEWGFLALVLLALGRRLWELDGRAMHYDEAIHLHYAWRLSNLETFVHSPWMHGPFQIEFTALILRILGDTDFTARLGYALFGAALVGLPYFLRDYLGRIGALFAGIMLTLSPAMLYFSRFGRNDIIMAFWATALFILMWRYIQRAENRYLYLASAVLAFMFATKETAYIVTLIFGGMMFLLALPDLVPWALGRVKLSQMAGPAGFLLLLVTLTLPQWSALTGLFQGLLGLSLVNPDGVSAGIVGAPHWAEPFLVLPLYHASWLVHGLAIALSLGCLLGFS
ncbi:MAG: flippase activity-associated protein Agl23, partial [Dehalococcoidales bacterium]